MQVFNLKNNGEISSGIPLFWLRGGGSEEEEEEDKVVTDIKVTWDKGDPIFEVEKPDKKDPCIMIVYNMSCWFPSEALGNSENVQTIILKYTSPYKEGVIGKPGEIRLVPISLHARPVVEGNPPRILIRDIRKKGRDYLETI